MYEDELGWTLDYDAGIMAGGGDFTKAFHAAQTGQRYNRCPHSPTPLLPPLHFIAVSPAVWPCSRRGLPALVEEPSRGLLHVMRHPHRRRLRGRAKRRAAACLWGCCRRLLAAEVAGSSVQARTAPIAPRLIKVFCAAFSC